MAGSSEGRLKCGLCTTFSAPVIYTVKSGKTRSGWPLLAGHLKKVHGIKVSDAFRDGYEADEDDTTDEAAEHSGRRSRAR